MRELKTYEKYKNLMDHLNETTDYYVYTFKSDGDCQHGPHHLENISKHKNVYKLEVSQSSFMPNKFNELSKKYFNKNLESES